MNIYPHMFSRRVLDDRFVSEQGVKALVGKQ